MHDPILRVFTLLELLQSRDRVTGAELADRLNVDLRTVQRYIVRLKDLGFPVASSPGVGGAYRLRSGFRLPPLLLTNEEAFALSLGLRALRQVGLSAFAPATESALAKLQRVLPETLRDSIRTVEDVVSMEPSPWVAPASMQCLIGAATAIRTSHRVRFHYQSHTDGRWYLIGHCLTRKAIRTFRLDRATHLEIRPTPFHPPPDFDPRAYLAQHMPFVQSDYAIDVWIDMPLEEADRSFALWRVATESEAGGTRLRCGRDRLELFAAMLLSTRRRIIVHTPAELRETFRDFATLSTQAAKSSTSPGKPAAR